MCDLFQANPWKPLLCTNCHQNRSGHQNLNQCEHVAIDSTSSMHLYEEIMAQYFPTTNQNSNEIIEDDEDSFSDEEQDLTKTSTIEFIQNQSMINTQGIVLIGPELRSKEIISTKKTKKIHLLKKSKSNADECLKKAEIIENNPSKLWWFKIKKTSVIQTESNKPNAISIPPITNQKIRVLPEMNKLTLNEALNIARRQHSSPNPEPKLSANNKPFRSLGVSNYGSSIASNTSSSTQSSTEYDPNSTYLTAISPTEKNISSIMIFDQINKLTIEHLTSDLQIIIAEYKQNLPVARFQTLKTFVNQYELTKLLSTESIYFLLLQIIDEYYQKSLAIITLDQFLITSHSTIPILVPTTSSSTIENEEEESIEELIKNLAKKFFHPSSLPIFNNLSTFENLSYRYLLNQFSNLDFDHQNISIQRIKLLELFWNKIQSLRRIQITDENERSIFTLYYLIRYISQSD